MHHSQPSGRQVQIVGLPISTYSRLILQRIAVEAKLDRVHVTSVHRTVRDQAQTFFEKHVKGKKKANYKNPAVSDIVKKAQDLLAKGTAPPAIRTYLVSSIEQVDGGAGSISRHLLLSPFIEIFDIAHYKGETKSAGRHNYMNDAQAKAFLNGCRELIPFPIERLGHSAELGIEMKGREFVDESCFHLEVLQPVFDRLEQDTQYRYA